MNKKQRDQMTNVLQQRKKTAQRRYEAALMDRKKESVIDKLNDEYKVAVFNYSRHLDECIKIRRG